MKPLLSRVIHVVAVFGTSLGAVAATIHFPNFTSAAAFTFNAQNTAVDPHLVGNELQVTTQGESGEVTSAWYNTPVFLNNGFTSTIQYRSTSTANFGNAWAFMIQNDPRGTAALGGGGTDVGGITHSLAVDLDFYEFSAGDYILSCGTGPNAQNPSPSCDLTNTANPSRTDGALHTIVVSYDPGTQVIAFNVDSGAAVASTRLPGDLNTYLGLNNGTGYVGFVGDNGFFSGNSDIVSWTLASNDPAPAGVPEPATLGLAAFALAAFSLRRSSEPRE